jgi:2-desacetyl-2-hydroxyethyl bacteriochlorophyllide A dehydrogenase
MTALVYEAPYQMNVREVAVPAPKPDEVLIRVTYSGICGSELSGFEGRNSLRKPPLIMGHEFSGEIAELGQSVSGLQVGQRVTANPLVWCGHCRYCLSGLQQLCPERKLLSAHLPGSNAQYVAVRAQMVHSLPDDMPMTTAALVEPAACALRAARIAAPDPLESALVVGAGPIGLLAIQALAMCGIQTIYAADLNAERLAMAESAGAVAVKLDADFRGRVDVAIDAVGASVTRQACVAAVRSAGRVVWIGLHEADSSLPINDMVRREISSHGTFGYSAVDFGDALEALAKKRFWLEETWTRIEPLERGSACFEELIHGSAVAKIWLTPPA